MTSVLSVASAKGGSGKTTTSTHIAAALASRGHATLLVDAEPQRNSCVRLLTGSEESPWGEGMSDILMYGRPLTSGVVPSRLDHLDVLRGGAELDSTSDWLVGQKAGPFLIRKRIIEPLVNAGVYKWIVIDTPPALGMLTAGSLIAADLVVSPVRASDSDSVAGVFGILDALDDLADFGPARHIGVVVTDISAPTKRSMSQKAVMGKVEREKWPILGEWRSYAAFGNSQGGNMTVGEWEPKSPAVKAILETADAIVKASKKGKRK